MLTSSYPTLNSITTGCITVRIMIFTTFASLKSSRVTVHLQAFWNKSDIIGSIHSGDPAMATADNNDNVSLKTPTHPIHQSPSYIRLHLSITRNVSVHLTSQVKLINIVNTLSNLLRLVKK